MVVDGGGGQVPRSLDRISAELAAERVRGGTGPWAVSPTMPQWRYIAPLVAMSPLLAYRVSEYMTLRWALWNPVALHSLPPISMLGASLACWRLVPPLPTRGGQRRSAHFGLSIALGMLLGTLAALANLVLMLADNGKDPYSGVAAAAARLDPGTTALVLHVLVLAPVAEEVAFRGLIFRVLRQSLPILSASFISALIFGLMHVYPAKAIWAFFLGMVAAMAYEQTRSLLTPMLIHGLFNAVPIGVAVLRAKPDDTGPIWLVLALAAVIFTLAARSAGRACDRRAHHL